MSVSRARESGKRGTESGAARAHAATRAPSSATLARASREQRPGGCSARRAAHAVLAGVCGPQDFVPSRRLAAARAWLMVTAAARAWLTGTAALGDGRVGMGGAGLVEESGPNPVPSSAGAATPLHPGKQGAKTGRFRRLPHRAPRARRSLQAAGLRTVAPAGRGARTADLERPRRGHCWGQPPRSAMAGWDGRRRTGGGIGPQPRSVQPRGRNPAPPGRAGSKDRAASAPAAPRTPCSQESAGRRTSYRRAGWPRRAHCRA
jgi:hypothetical protein